MNEELYKMIIEAITNKSHMKGCPVCRGRNLSMIDGIFLHMAHTKNMNPFNVEGKCLPAVSLVCDDCGHLVSFALKVLLPNWEEVKDKYLKD